MKYFELFYLSQVIPIISISFVLLLFIFKLYYEIRSRYNILVNCWFCNENAKVPFKDKNSWICPNSVCRQYNGFTKEGDYNKEIVEQFDSSRNLSSCTENFDYDDDNVNYIINGEIVTNANGFCNDCNENQRLKVEKLSQFEPRKENNYEQELKKYRQHLEELYRLCPTCEKQLGKTLREKKKMILGSKFLDFLSRGADTLNKHPKVILIKKLHYSKWKTLTTLLILLLAISNFYFSIRNTINILREGLDEKIADPAIRFILSSISYVTTFCNIIQNILLEVFDIPILKKSFLFMKTILFLSLQYVGIKLPKLYMDYDKVITFGIPLASIFLTFLRNVLDGFHITRYTILLTIWSINVGVGNMQYFNFTEGLKLITSMAALIFSIPKLNKYSDMNMTNSFHKIYSEDSLLDDEDSISLLSSLRGDSFNNSLKSFRTNGARYSQSSKKLINSSSPNFEINHKSNSHSPVSPFKRYQTNEDNLSHARTFVPINQYSPRQFISNMEVNRTPQTVFGSNNFMGENSFKPFPNTNGNLYRNFDSYNKDYTIQNTFGTAPAKNYGWNCNMFNDKGSMCEERFAPSPFCCSTSQQTRSNVLTPSRLGFSDKNFGFGTQSWISGGFFNSNQRDTNIPRYIVNSAQNQNLTNTDALSRASSQSSGFESNTSSVQNNGIRYKDASGTNLGNDLNSNFSYQYEDGNRFDVSSSRLSLNTFNVDRTSTDRIFEPINVDQLGILHHTPSTSNQDLNSSFHSRKSQFDNFYQNEDWRQFKVNNSKQNGFGMNGVNSFNLTRMNEELRPIQRGSLLRKWKEQNCVS